MDLRRELLFTIGALVALNFFLAFGCIGLFVRMGPAIERILQENVYSLVAAEEILVELAGSNGEPLTGEARTRASEALEKAKKNVTEEDERPVLASLERHLPQAMAGEPEARRRVVADSRQLIRINHVAMTTVDDEARRLGNAGAWSAVLIGFLSFLMSLIVVVRLQNRLVRPLVDLYEVLESVRLGERLRRCRVSDAPREVVQVTQSVNTLLDERLQRSATAAAGGETGA